MIPMAMHSKKPLRVKINKKECYVVVAAYNEERHIADVVRRCKAQGFPVIVANDGSRDHTAELAERAGAMVVSHITNLGKGAVMKTGAEHAKELSAKAIIFLDGDGQHKPEELPLFLRDLNLGNQIVFGYRKQTGNMPFLRSLGKFMTRSVVRIFYNLDLEDILCGYRALTIDAYNKVKWVSRDYSVESEIIARAGKQNLLYSEFEIATIYHDNYKGVTIFDGIGILLNLIWWRMTH